MPQKVALIGLGVGAVAAYARDGDDYRFYEIDPVVAELAEVVHEIFRRLEHVLPNAGYNTIVRTAPWRPEAECYHWRVEIRPRIAPLAGLECATGIHINHIAPEHAANLLREA